MASPPDIFALLELPAGADAERVKRAYRARAMALHPDRNPGDATAAARFNALNAAYGAWSSAQPGAPRTANAAPTDIDFNQLNDLFADFFGPDGAFAGAKASAGHGRDLRTTLRLTESEAARGVRREVAFDRGQPCPTCDGTGATPGTEVRDCAECEGRGQTTKVQGSFQLKLPCAACRGRGKRAVRPCSECRDGFVTVREKVLVTVPPGVQVGQVLRLAGKGEPGTTGEAGHLYVALEISPGVEGERQGDDAHIEVLIDPADAVRGHRVTVSAPDGDCEVVIPAGVRSGERVVVRGRGYVRGEADAGDPRAAYRDAVTRGDLVVSVKVRGASSKGRATAAIVGLGLVAAAVAAVLLNR